MVALRELTLEVQDREFFVLVGPSGCGKTTALRIVAGLEEPSEGGIYIGNRRVNEVPAKDRDLAMVFQSYALYPHMSVYDNLAFGLRMRGYGREELDRRVREAAATLGLQELLRRRPGELSGGQRQRVALGRAIVRQPQVFLMDEPLSNLDAKMRVQTRAQLIRLHQQLGTTFLYVTHDQVEAMTMGQRLAVLDGGALQQVGTPQEVYERPANRFVAEFIGTPAMNFFEGEPSAIGGRLGLQLADAFVSLSPAQVAAVQQAGGERVLLGVRPEHLAPREGGVGDFAACFDGQVDLTESLGSEQHVTVSLPRGSLVARLPGELRLRRGSLVRLAVAPRHLHLFDAETERRIGP